MSSPPEKRGPNRGSFQAGPDSRRRRGFTREECQKGYQAAKAKMDARSPNASAWFFRHIRGFYRRKKREAPKPPLRDASPRGRLREEPPR